MLVTLTIARLRRRLFLSILTAVLAFVFFALILAFDQLVWLAPVAFVVGDLYALFALFAAHALVDQRKTNTPTSASGGIVES